MTLHQVGARTEGDVYQGLFFWRQAADLLRPNSLVERVILEHDDAVFRERVSGGRQAMHS